MPERKRRILCAESNKDVGDLIALMLGQKGYEVETVQTAADCLKVASTDRFDLYILNDTYIDADSLELCLSFEKTGRLYRRAWLAPTRASSGRSMSSRWRRGRCNGPRNRWGRWPR